MRINIISIILSLISAYSLNAQTLTFASNTPEAGIPLDFYYNPTGGKLENLSEINCTSYSSQNKRISTKSSKLTKVGDSFKGTINTTDSTSFVLISFTSGNLKDENPMGYYTMLYKNSKPLPMAYFWLAQFYNGYGASYVGAVLDKAKGLSAYEKALQADEQLREEYLSDYFKLKLEYDKLSGSKIIKNEIVRLNSSTTKNEVSLLKIVSYYSLLESKSAADSVNNFILENYPKGILAYKKISKLIDETKIAKKKEDLIKQAIIDFKLSESDNIEKVDDLYSQLANAYGLAKNNESFEFYTNKISNIIELASIYNTYAKASADSKTNLDFAAKISEKSVNLIQLAKNQPLPERFQLKEDYLEFLTYNLINYENTYATLLGYLGRYNEAAIHQEIAITANNYTNLEMNERYVQYLSKIDGNIKLVEIAEKLIKNNKGTTQIKQILKSVYSGKISFDAYYENLSKEAYELEKPKYLKEMLNLPAPMFALVNLKGEQVDLAKLKGKVVILDFWATWCGPCVASFPAMQIAVDKYKMDDKVVFLFVNTLQIEEDRKNVVKAWVAKNPYKFNILLDTKLKTDPNKFEVLEKYKVSGIPTKFIIDGEGIIRFRKGGFSGSAEATVKELDMMIGLAKSASK